ncbi:unnamed protein product [Effrenium voratum]|nr:unnamed protein product [Effrenium voratum]
MRGWRPAMEDATCALSLEPPLGNYALFGVFDGHGGAAVSRRAAQELPNGIQAAALECMDEDLANLPQFLSTALANLDEVLRHEGEGQAGLLQVGGKAIESSVRSTGNAYGLMGSTAVVALVECLGASVLRVVVGNLGDSRAICCRAGEAIPLSEDHKPDVPEERERIEKAGGFVGAVGPCQRIDGWGLNLSRALGDFHYKSRSDLAPSEQKVSIEPDVQVLEVTPEDEFLFLGCDGVFELHSSQDVVDAVRQGLQAGQPLQEVVEDLVDASCSPDLAQTGGAGSDNVSAMVILLKPERF